MNTCSARKCRLYRRCLWAFIMHRLFLQWQQLDSARPQTAVWARQRPQRKSRQSDLSQQDTDDISQEQLAGDGFSAEFAAADTSFPARCLAIVMHSD